MTNKVTIEIDRDMAEILAKNKHMHGEIGGACQVALDKLNPYRIEIWRGDTRLSIDEIPDDTEYYLIEGGEIYIQVRRR